MAKLKTFTMTEPQRKLAADNHNLIYGYMNRHGLDEEWYGTLAEALCIAAVNFDETKGFEFSTFAYKTMGLRYSRDLSVQNMQVRKANYEASSLDETLTEDSDKTFLDSLAGETDVESEVIANVLADGIYAQMSDKGTEICRLLIRGYTRADIARLYGVTHQAISNHIKGTKKRLESAGALEALRA